MSLYHEVFQSRVYINPFLVLSAYRYQMTGSVSDEYLLCDCLEAEAIAIKTGWFLPSQNSRQNRKGHESLASGGQYIFTV